MRCHYEVLGVDQKASGDEIKKCYRKLALKLHPDKNLNEDPEVAKSVFQELQQAFEVLSDPQERAWYDRHRDAILSGANDEKPGDDVDLFPYFTSGCYKGFDGEGGFYDVYRQLFVQIASDEEDGDEWPFGDGDSPEKEWQAFYAFWSGFTTTKTFAFLDQYDTRHADNRRIFRAMEKENKKFRDVGKKEYNDLVRSLVAFVRKRDPRVKAYNQKLEAKREENAKKTAENRKKQLAEQARLRSEAAEAYKKSTLGMKSMEDELEKLEDALDAEEEDTLYCAACDKEMRNEKAFATHQKSSKHLENVERLKELLREEEGILEDVSSDASGEEVSEGDGSDPEDEDDIHTQQSDGDSAEPGDIESVPVIPNTIELEEQESDGSPSVNSEKVTKNKQKGQNKMNKTDKSGIGSENTSYDPVNADGNDSEDLTENEPVIPKKAKNKKSKKGAAIPTSVLSENEDICDPENCGSDDQPVMEETRKGKNKKSKRQTQTPSAAQIKSFPNSSAKKNKKKKGKSKGAQGFDSGDELLHQQMNGLDIGDKMPKSGYGLFEDLTSKAADANDSTSDGDSADEMPDDSKVKKPAKKSKGGIEANVTITSSVSSRPKNKKRRRNKVDKTTEADENEHEQTADPLTCQVCKSTFQSKNKLFSHLKDTKHAIYLGK